ncbi:hypothetical protein HUO13_00420 [Saccharopolyspora erythraea]|uniref:hypothetical protein n=1 Tax=Saccharopolyspora erythraea TaxID=1836 RepID=UPI001BA7A212|nr:hypothetical protein [Saccharopolyspora erythraea]QUG99467.1 hypothetical protein HUO13_00420 [Saccharopolyspora erythraea]
MPGQVEGTGYSVVPDSLRGTTTAWEGSRDRWLQLASRMDGEFYMPDNAMGLLGREQNFPQSYNEARSTIARKLAEGAEVLATTSTDLDRVATEYEEKDYEYYKKFGYLNDEMDDRVSGSF